MSLRPLCLLCAILLIGPIVAADLEVDLGKTPSSPGGIFMQLLRDFSRFTWTPTPVDIIDIYPLDSPPDSSGTRAYVPKAQGSDKNLTDEEFKKILNVRIEPDDPYVRDAALLLVAKFPGNYTIDQICSIYDYLKNGDEKRKGWSYVRDPRGVNYFNYANESLRVGDQKECAGAGDCDDFAILMSSLVESIGGTTRIILAQNNSTGAHAYAEVYLGQLDSQERQVIEIIEWLKQKYNTESIFVHVDPNAGDVWLNLDWESDISKSGHPGGPFYQGDRQIKFNINEESEITQPILLPTEDERQIQNPAIPLDITTEKIESNSADVWFNKGFALNNLGKYEEAKEAFDKVIDMDPNNTAAWNNKGYALNNLGRYEEGLLAFEKALVIDPNNIYAWNNKAWALNNLAGYEDALLASEKALEIDPNNFLASGNKVLAVLGIFLTDLNSTPNNIEGDSSDVWFNKGFELNNLGKYEEAIEAFDRVIDMDPSNAYAWNNKGYALINLGRYEDGLQACEKAIEIDPNNVYAWNNKAWALNNLGRYEEALQSSEKALEIDPYYSNAQSNKAWALDNLGNSSSADINFDIVLDKSGKLISSSFDNENVFSSFE